MIEAPIGIAFRSVPFGSTEFLPIKIAESEEDQDAVREYCEPTAFYLPQ
jgi:hypothetical protein